MSAHPAILDELDNIVDVQQQPSNVWLEKNPLARVELDDQIHDLVSHHLGRFHVSPFTSDSIRSRAAKVFYTHFFIGLLTSVKAKNDRIHSVYQRRTQNTLELVAVYGEEDTGTLHIHKINFPGAQTEKKEPLNERRMAAIKYEIEFQMKGQQLAISEEFSIEEAEVYEYEMIEKRTNLEGDHVGLEMELTNNYVVEKEEMPTNVEALDRVTAREYEPLTKTSTPKGFWRFFEGGLVDFSDIEHEPDMVTLADIAVDTLTALDHVRINPMDKLHEIPNTLARGAGFLHGALFAVLPDEYYRRIMSADLPAVHCDGNSAFLYFAASPQMLPEHALVDVDTKNINIPHGYKLIKHLKTKDHLVKIREVRYAANDKSTDHKVEEWNTHSVLQNILSDARRADGSDAQQFETNCKHYFDVTREMIADEKFGNRITSLSSMKANIFGQLKTDSNVKVIIGLSNMDDAVNYFHIQMSHQFGYLIDFDTEHVDAPTEDLIENLKGKNMPCMNFRFEDGKIQISVTTRNRWQIKNPLQGAVLKSVNLKTTLEQITASDDSSMPALKQKFHDDLQSLLGELKIGYLPQNVGDAYLAGALSNIDVTSFDVQQSNKGMSVNSNLNIRNKKISLKWEVLKDYLVEPASEAVQNINNNEDTFTIAYNLFREDSNLAVGASSTEHLSLNTDNVNAICSPNLRRKRNVIPYCRLYSEEGEEVKKVNYEEIEESVKQRYPSLHEHISILHEVSGKLQLAFIGRDMIGQQHQKDWHGFAKSVLFFGATRMSAKVGQSIAATGRSAKMAGQSIKGAVLETVGGCFAMIGFDVYMGYRLKEEIERNDTTSAKYTSTYIGLDLVECGVTAMAAFGLTVFAPAIIGVISILRVFTLIAQNVEETNHKIGEIKAVLPLTPHEVVYETLREFLHLGTDEVIESMVSEVTANEAAVKYSLNQYPQFNRFLISAASKLDKETLFFINDNKIDLTKTFHFNKSRLMPRSNVIGEHITTFCSLNEAHNANKKELEQSVKVSSSFLDYFSRGSSMTSSLKSQQPKPYTNPINDFYCENAFGVTNVNKSHPSKTLYLLFNGTDSVVAFPSVENVFLLMNGNKSINGGEQSDTFAIQAEDIFGYLNGSDGEDTADFSSSNSGNDLVIRNGEAFFNPMQDKNQTLKLYNIETVIGRKGLNDYIEVCNEKKIDSGGSTYGMDRIIITNKCSRKMVNLTIILRENTFVSCDTENSLIRYIVADECDTDLVLKAGRHEVQINSFDYINFTMHMGKYFRSMKFAHSSIIRLQTDDISCVSFFFVKENLTMKIDEENNITLYVHNANNVFNIIEKYAEYIERNLHVKLIANTNEGIIVLNHNLFTTEIDGRTSTMNLISNGHHNNMQLIGHRLIDNYFWISTRMDEFSRLNIVIHPHLSELSHCYIDLHNLTLEVHENTEGEYGLFLESEKHDDHIILTVFGNSNTEKVDQIIEIGQINITNSHKFMDQITVYLYGENKFSNIKNKVWLKPSPIQVNKTFLTIMPGQFEFHSEINFNYTVSNLAAYRMNESLLLTNIVKMEETSHQIAISIVLSEFFVYQAKYDTLNLIFKNKILDMAELLDSVQDIRSMWIGIKEALDEAKKNSITAK